LPFAETVLRNPAGISPGFAWLKSKYASVAETWQLTKSMTPHSNSRILSLGVQQAVAHENPLSRTSGILV